MNLHTCSNCSWKFSSTRKNCPRCGTSIIEIIELDNQLEENENLVKIDLRDDVNFIRDMLSSSIGEDQEELDLSSYFDKDPSQWTKSQILRLQRCLRCGKTNYLQFFTYTKYWGGRIAPKATASISVPVCFNCHDKVKLYPSRYVTFSRGKVIVKDPITKKWCDYNDWINHNIQERLSNIKMDCPFCGKPVLRDNKYCYSCDNPIYL